MTTIQILSKFGVKLPWDKVDNYCKFHRSFSEKGGGLPKNDELQKLFSKTTHLLFQACKFRDPCDRYCAPRVGPNWVYSVINIA
jgi:hypothetical protein